MNSLSTILADIETSASKMTALETELAAERENGKRLIDPNREQSDDALKILGIDNAARRERKPRSNEAVMISAAVRAIRSAVKGGEKNAKNVLAAALEAADKTAKGKLQLGEVPAEVKTKIEERVKNLGKK